VSKKKQGCQDNPTLSTEAHIPIENSIPVFENIRHAQNVLEKQNLQEGMKEGFPGFRLFQGCMSGNSTLHADSDTLIQGIDICNSNSLKNQEGMKIVNPFLDMCVCPISQITL